MEVANTTTASNANGGNTSNNDIIEKLKEVINSKNSQLEEIQREYD